VNASNDNTPVIRHDVVVSVRTGMVGTEDRQFHWRGSAASCRRKAMLKTGAVRIVSVAPVTEAQWIRAYGLNQRM